MSASHLPSVIGLGEAIAEFMRPGVGSPLDQTGTFAGPFPSGAPAIFADSAARLGLPTGFVGTVGDDAFGRMFRARLAADHIDVSHLGVDARRTTGTAFVAYRRDGSRDFLFHLKESAAAQVPVVDASYLAAAKYVHVTGSTLAINREWRDACRDVAMTAKAAGAQIAFDPNVRPELLGGLSMNDVCGSILDLADIVLPSGEELVILTGTQDVAEAVQILLRRGATKIILKQGAAGSTLFTANQSVHVPAKPQVERDPTGAGDAFAGAVAYAVLHGLPAEAMLRLANTVGGLAVTTLGPMEGLPSLEDALQAIV